uniref:Odorant receptor, family 55, subfamily E, member 1 n=1 Tax=Hucho hucho TaxID=62062 RepID=A0A4W5R493_9TELE
MWVEMSIRPDTVPLYRPTTNYTLQNQRPITLYRPMTKQRKKTEEQQVGLLWDLCTIHTCQSIENIVSMKTLKFYLVFLFSSQFIGNTQSVMIEEFQGINSSHSEFIFVGFPEIYEYRRLLFLPFFMTYILVLVGNSLLIYVIRIMESLHSPMYILICGLAAVDIVVATVIIPNMLLSFLFDWNDISLASCLTQMFFTHFLSSVESTILLAMALDRYVAVCFPLHYTRILNSAMFVRLLLFTVIRSGSIMFVLVALAGSLSFCGSNVIKHCYCDHMALVSLACGNTDKNNAMGLAVIICFVGIDICVVIFSYMKIVNVVLSAAVGVDRRKAFHTCGTHLIVIMCFYLIGTVTFLSRNLNIQISTDINTFLGVMYIILPASVNPIIYGVRTKEIRNRILKMFNTRVNKVLTVQVAIVEM